MKNYRIEAVVDSETGLFRIEIFSPRNSTVPVGKTKAIYASHEEAVRRVDEAIRAVLSAKKP